MEFLRKSESRGPLSCDTVLKIFYQTCRAVQHMHRQKPPIIHRDLKVSPPPLPVAGEAPVALPADVRPVWELGNLKWLFQKLLAGSSDRTLCVSPNY